MPPIRDEAIVLRHLDYSETSQVLACLTREHGPRRFIAKGIKRSTKQGRPSATIDLLERGTAVFLVKAHAEDSLALLTEWQQADAYLGLRTHLPAWYAAQYAAEITSAMTEEADPHAEVFDALAGLLHALASGSEVLPAIVGYQCGLILSTGFWPDLSRCMVCNRPAPPGRAGYYAPVQGGLVCRQCEPQVSVRHYVKADTLQALRTREFDGGGAEAARSDRPNATSAAFHLLDQTIGTAVGRVMALAKMVLHPPQ